MSVINGTIPDYLASGWVIIKRIGEFFGTREDDAKFARV